MAATLSAGVNSVILKLDTPYDTIRTTDIRDDLIKVKVWCSTTTGFTPSDSNKVFDALSLSVVISKLADGTDLVAGTPYFVKYAFISDIDETVYTVSSQLTATPIVASAQTVDISGYSAFVKSSTGTFTPTSATLTAVLNGIVTPVYAWTISGGTLSATNTSSVTVTPAANATSVTVTLSVTGTGLTTPIVKTIVMAVVNDGQNATAYGLVVSAGAIQRTKAGVLNPTTITVYGYSAIGVTTPGLYAGRFKIYENGSATASYTSVANESTYTYTPSSANITSIKAELYLAGGTVNKVDEQTIPVVVDGTDTITAVLSNESATVPADSTGTVTSFAGANTTMTVYVGATDDSANWTYSVTKSNVTCTEATTSRTQTVTALSAISGYVDITASKSGYSSITKRFNINKSLNGATGPTGPQGPTGSTGPVGYSTPTFYMSTYGATFRKDVSGNIYPSSVVIDTGYSNFKDTPAPTFQWKKDGVDISGATSYSYSVPSADYVSATSHTYSCVITGQDLSGTAKSITSTTTIPLIEDGARGPRTASGYLYYQTATATAPGTPSASNYNFTTGQFTTLTSASGDTGTWGYNPISPSTTDTTKKAWASRYVVLEPTYGQATGAATISTPASSINFDGIVTFTNYASGTTPLATAASVANKLDTTTANSSTFANSLIANTTVIDGGKITTGTISAARLDLSGVLTATSVSNTGTTTIDGGRIGTGTINAARLDLTGVLKVGTAANDINTNTTEINGGKITTGSIDANRLTIGNTTGNDRIRLYDNKIEIWNGGVRRIVLGDLS